MTTIALARPDVRTWDELRSPAFESLAPFVIAGALPSGLELSSVTHLRTAHYAVHPATTTDGSAWVVRIGIMPEEDDTPADNTGYQGTSIVSPAGQRREMEIARGFAAAGTSVSVPEHLIGSVALVVLWVPFLTGSGQPLTAARWHAALTELRAYRPAKEMPVFVNRPESFAPHLVNRAGLGENTGYTASELAGLFPFTDTALDAALGLRKVAAEIARAHRERTVRLGAPAVWVAT